MCKITKKYDSVPEQLELFDIDQISSGVWTVKEVAAYLKVSAGHIYNLISKGRIPFRKRDGIIRFIPNEIFNWLNGGV